MVRGSNEASGFCRGLDQTLAQRRVVEVRERAPTSGDIERAISVMWHRSDAWRRVNGARFARDGDDHLGDFHERMGLPCRDIERTDAFVSDDLDNEIGHVVDKHMVAPFFALAKQVDVFALIGQASKAVWAITVMRVGSAIDQGRPELGQG